MITSLTNEILLKLLFSRKIFLLLFLFLNWITGTSQINLTATGGTTTASYSTLGAAFTAIDSGTHTGQIVIAIFGNTTETSSATLIASGTSNASYSSILILPSGGVARSITGNISGLPLIDLNGADNVLINGLNTGGNSLTFENQSSSATSTSTIRFINDACGNKIQNCTILGGSSSLVSGIILFSTAKSTGTPLGNDNDTISNCTLDGSGSNLPWNSIICFGTPTIGKENSGINISNNNIANFFSVNTQSYGILDTVGGTGWTITGNKFYQSSTRTYTAPRTHSAICILNGDGFTINGNTIGYASQNSTGVYTMTGNDIVRFVGMRLKFDTLLTNSINNNRISKISLTTAAGQSNTEGNIRCITLNSGIALISGNTCGDTIGIESIISISSTTGGSVSGLHITSLNSVTIINNTFGALKSIGGTGFNGSSVFGISIYGYGSQLIVKNNIIGNSTPDNIFATDSNAQYGAYSFGINIPFIRTSVIINKNIIRNIVSYKKGLGSTSGVYGIYTGQGSDAYPQFSNIIDSNTIYNLSTNSRMAVGIQYYPGIGSVSYNTIFNLACLDTGFSDSRAAGIYLYNPISPLVRGNRIFNLKNAGAADSSTGAWPLIVGILTDAIGSGTYTIINNMISLGIGQSSQACVIGIFANQITCPQCSNPSYKIYYNTINIEGVSTNPKMPSFGFHRGRFRAFDVIYSTGTVDLRNNIISNTRTGGINKHFAIGNYYASQFTPYPWYSSFSNYNVLNADSSTIAYWLTSRTFASWKAASNCDSASFTKVPLTFVNNNNDLHLQADTLITVIESGGVNITGFTNDFDFQNRPGPSGSVNGGAHAPDIGCDEIDGFSRIRNNIIGNSQTICLGSSPSTFTGSTPLGGAGSYSYQWQKSTTSATAGFTSISGATSIGYSPGNLNINTWFRRIVTATLGADTSAAIAITFHPAMLNTISSSQSICIGSSSAPLTGPPATGGGSSVFNYQWITSIIGADTGFTSINGANATGYSPGALTVTTWYRRIAYSSMPCTDTSAAIQITVNPPISSNNLGSSQLICTGTAASTITGSSPSGGGGNYTYQWIRSVTSTISGFTPISGATSIDYAPGIFPVIAWYRRIVRTNSCTDTSGVVIVNLNPLITSNNISSSQNICYGESPASLTGLTPSGGGGGYAFQWLKSTTDSFSGYSLITGATASGYLPGALIITTWYRRIVTTATCVDTSSAIKITVIPLIISNTISSSQSICSGNIPTMLTGSSPSGGGGGYLYQWLESTTNASNSYSAISGATAINYAPPAITVSTWCRRIVKTNSCSDTSIEIKISVIPQITNNIISSSQTVCVGSAASPLTGSNPSGGGGGYSYQWQTSIIDSISGFSIISGATLNNYAPGILPANAWFRRIVSTATCSDTSTMIHISLNSVPTISLAGLDSVCSGDTVMYNVIAPTGVSYSWNFTGGTIFSGSGTNSVRVIWSTTGTGNVAITVTNPTTNCTSTATKNITINPTPLLPIITRNLGILSIPTQSGAAYQWYLNGNSISGAVNNTYDASTNNGIYSVKVILGLCSIISTGYIYTVGLNTEPSLSELNIFPNPNNGCFTISAFFLKTTDLKIKLYDISGRELMLINEGEQTGKFTKTLNISDFAKGIYFINLVTEEGSMVGRIVVR